jgi:hypothetical protein
MLIVINNLYDYTIVGGYISAYSRTSKTVYYVRNSILLS